MGTAYENEFLNMNPWRAGEWIWQVSETKEYPAGKGAGLNGVQTVGFPGLATRGQNWWQKCIEHPQERLPPLLSHEDLLWLEKNFFFNSLPKLCYQNTKIKVKENKKLKNPLFITTIKVYILNIIQNISQGDTCMVGCACKRQTPHTPKDTDRWSAFSARNKPIPWMWTR